MTEWRTGWDASRPLRIRTGFTSLDGRGWAAGLRPGVTYRDLGLTAATDGMMGAQHIRLTPEAADATDWHYHDVDFQWFYVLNGTITIRSEDDGEVVLRAGDSGYHPPCWRHLEHSASSDYEAVEVTAPARFDTVEGRDASKPDAARRFSHLDAVYTRDEPENYIRGDGPRSYVLYRDLGTREPTEGRIHIHVIKVDGEAPPVAGTGDHTHSMAQFFMPLKGWIELTAEGEPRRRCGPGDFYMLDAGVVHNAVAASKDYMTLEMCIPAEYETTPAGRSR